MVKAANDGDWDALENELLEGGDVESRDEFGKTLLNICANAGHDKIVVQLVENHEANIEASDSRGWTPLMSAAHNNHEKVVRFLLEKGANVEVTNSYGLNVYSLATEEMKGLLVSVRPSVAVEEHKVEEVKAAVEPAEETKAPAAKKGGKAAVAKSGSSKKAGVKKAAAAPAKPGKSAGKKK